jgi:hypothetical protein
MTNTKKKTCIFVFPQQLFGKVGSTTTSVRNLQMIKLRKNEYLRPGKNKDVRMKRTKWGVGSKKKKAKKIAGRLSKE